jgi:putative transcriptional regulator
MARKELQNSVREVRTEMGLTQAQLAEAVGVSRQSINYIEQGTIAPSITLVLRIAAVLEQNVESLFSLEDAHG